MNNSQILDAALKCGFAISSTHGISEGQDMPISDSATLIDFAREIIRLVSQEARQEPPEGL